jgi:hypothetical protein
MKLTRVAFMRSMLLLIVLAGHVAQLTQSISQFALKSGEEEIKRRGWWAVLEVNNI